MLAACGNRNNFSEKAVHGASGVRIPPGGEARPDQPDFSFSLYFPEVVFGFSEEEWKVLRRNILLPTYYYIRHCAYLHTNGYT